MPNMRTTQAGLGIRGILGDSPRGDSYKQHLADERARANAEATLKYGGKGQFAKVRYGLANWFGGEKFAQTVTKKFGNKAQMEDAYSSQVQSRIGKYQGPLKVEAQPDGKLDEILGVVTQIATKITESEREAIRQKKLADRVGPQGRARASRLGVSNQSGTPAAVRGLIGGSASPQAILKSYVDSIVEEKVRRKDVSTLKYGGAGFGKAAQYQATRWFAGDRAADFMAKRGAGRPDVEAAYQRLNSPTVSSRVSSPASGRPSRIGGTIRRVIGRKIAAGSTARNTRQQTARAGRTQSSGLLSGLSKLGRAKPSPRGAPTKLQTLSSTVDAIRGDIQRSEELERGEEFKTEIMRKLDEILLRVGESSSGGFLSTAAIIAAITAAFSAKPLATGAKAAINALSGAARNGASAAVDGAKSAVDSISTAASNLTKAVVGAPLAPVAAVAAGIRTLGGTQDAAAQAVQPESPTIVPQPTDRVSELEEALSNVQEVADTATGARMAGTAPTARVGSRRAARPRSESPKGSPISPPVIIVRNIEQSVSTYTASIFDHPVVHPGIYKM